MKSITILCAAFALITVAWLARAAEGQDRPPGVDPKEWVAVSKDLGLVLVPMRTAPDTPPTAPAALLLVPATSGYFMARMGDGTWRRVVIIDPIKGPAGAG